MSAPPPSRVAAAAADAGAAADASAGAAADASGAAADAGAVDPVAPEPVPPEHAAKNTIIGAIEMAPILIAFLNFLH